MVILIACATKRQIAIAQDRADEVSLLICHVVLICFAASYRVLDVSYLLFSGKVKVLPDINMTPLMNVSAKIMQFQAIVRLSFSPVLLDLPLVGGLHISFLERPKLDFDIR